VNRRELAKEERSNKHIEQSGPQAMMKFTAQRAGSSCAKRSADQHGG